MTSVYVAGGIIVVLILMVCYAFMIQTVTKKKEQQQRLTHALEQRIKKFRILLSGFPEGFLPQDLTLLIYRHLIDAAQQLTALCPKESNYIEELELFSREMSDIQRRPPAARRIRVESPKQGKEIKQYLTELNKFVHRLHQRGKLAKADFDAHSADIRQLVLHIAVDNYISHATTAESADKPKMALHYYTLARNLLGKDTLNKEYKQRLNEINRHIIRLESIVDDEPKEIDAEESPTNDTAWNEFGAGDESWKKKAIYD